ncbi:DUF2145 domain-containing protein [Marinomonas balearica]|uniref:DUF2145 domain-containing protein n=1 Tax=Marinomonas balearica TaxID=491947 RepID=A0A4R6M5T8_9GAMM|nr:DUF2145 domain-containing protein [Marinomonas balearica]TDO96721.1 hypothetical protein DFP79_2486 [Marinomonas balearica]
MKFVIAVITSLMMSTFMPVTVWAGSQSNQNAQISADRVVTFAKNVEKYAASQQARAFIIARVGRPEKDLPKGINYTHTAVAIYSDIKLNDGETVQGYAIHNLYQLDNARDKSQLVMDYPVDFFWGADTLKAGIIIPNETVQTRLIELYANGDDKKLHNKNYSVIANPFDSELQNCTEYTLDLLNAAIYQTTNRNQLKANAKAYFDPQPLDVSPLKLALGSMFVKDVATRDHDEKVQTTTFTTIYRYLDKFQLVNKGVSFYEDQHVVTL